MNRAVTVRYFFFTTALPIFRDTNLPAPIFLPKFDRTLRFPPVAALAVSKAPWAGPND
jgi:hypothetical protein